MQTGRVQEGEELTMMVKGGELELHVRKQASKPQINQIKGTLEDWNKWLAGDDAVREYHRNMDRLVRVEELVSRANLARNMIEAKSRGEMDVESLIGRLMARSADMIMNGDDKAAGYEEATLDVFDEVMKREAMVSSDEAAEGSK